MEPLGQKLKSFIKLISRYKATMVVKLVWLLWKLQTFFLSVIDVLGSNQPGPICTSLVRHSNSDFNVRENKFFYIEGVKSSRSTDDRSSRYLAILKNRKTKWSQMKNLGPCSQQCIVSGKADCSMSKLTELPDLKIYFFLNYQLAKYEVFWFFFANKSNLKINPEIITEPTFSLHSGPAGSG